MFVNNVTLLMVKVHREEIVNLNQQQLKPDLTRFILMRLVITCLTNWWIVFQNSGHYILCFSFQLLQFFGSNGN